MEQGLKIFTDKLEDIQARINRACTKVSRLSTDVVLVAVTKTQPIEILQLAINAGIKNFGENRVQEAESKIPFLKGEDINWHLIGHLQSNKVKKAIALFNIIHSIDSISLAQRLNSLAHQSGLVFPIMLQVHFGQEDTKSGVLSEELSGVFKKCSEFRYLKLQGLMAIPPYFADIEQVRPYFSRLRELRDNLNKLELCAPMTDLSMGMSHDFEVAIEEGSTMVRVGTALFGKRIVTHE